MTEETNNNSQLNEEKLPTQEETIKEFDKEINEKLKILEKEKEEYLSGWKRAKADLLNYQKETEAKMQNFAMFANATLVFDLLAIIDSFDLAIGALTEKDKETSLGRGYYLVQTQLLDLLRKYGLEKIEVGGKDNKSLAVFNPNFHEAVSTKVCDKKDCDKIDDGAIFEVLSKGYMLNGKLLRPAKVRVMIHDK
mgnify:CR=1 FL=1